MSTKLGLDIKGSITGWRQASIKIDITNSDGRNVPKLAKNMVAWNPAGRGAEIPFIMIGFGIFSRN